MSDTIPMLQQRMDAAVLALDFEEARRCRDRIALMRGGATAVEAEQADLSGLERQKPGAMGLGTSQQKVTPPEGWTPPVKPDPMTSRTAKGGRGQRRRP
ncbi:excinuclease ABC subunit B [Altererythrobacter xixiisoli]|uniref:Excinuclease ABC subunit B n=1 Tax=Croceibacterium xixiisoli TaxID=1476466 RepID=A0A6I4TY52_9SPHN|nr:UvrB/UvrC motif-containing protein [Croceibacterium xixiisoli]MXP00925.1 excinuclease ABC subunit B [Croceibacterium xixiisoli]